MNLKNQPPVLVPEKFRSEIEKLSKATLMDLAWDYAQRCAGTDDQTVIISEFRGSAEIIKTTRQNAKG